MDSLTFLTKIVDSLAWPAVAVIIAFILRKKLNEIIPSLKKFKAGPIEAEFNAEARSILDKSKALLAKMPEPSIESDSKKDEIKLSKIYSDQQDPVKMVLEGWSSVDGALFRIGRDAGVIDDVMDSINSVYRTVISSDLLNQTTKELVIEIYEMRNRVAHAAIIPSLKAARDYLLAVEQVVNLIEEERRTVQKIGNAKY
jgi:hypothetical protein